LKHKKRSHRKKRPGRLRALWGTFGPHPHKNGMPALFGIHSTQEFSAILVRERARANRNGHEFSLVVFDPGRAQPNSAYTRWLAQVLMQRVRATDEIGWFDDCHIGLVLPYTGPESALKVADDVRQIISAVAVSPRYTVYSYPSRWLAGDDRHESQRLTAGISH
jgi:hypothetical protein